MAPPVEQPSLTVLSGSLGGTVFIVDDSVDNILIGSDASCRFALPGTGVDPIHARLWIDLEGITVYDTDSPRGVYINDDRVQGQARLRNGDILWLGAPGDDRSVMLQCRLPGAEPPAAAAPRAPAAAPEIEPTVAMMAIDLDPTVSLIPEPPTALSIDDAPSEPTVLLAPDAIQPEPTVMQAPEDAFTEPEATVVMLPDDLELSEDGGLEMKPAANLSGRIEEPPPTFTGWDATAGGITAASDAPWMAGAPASAVAPEPAAIVDAPPPVPRRDPEPPPVPVAAPKRVASPDARAPEPPPAPKPRRQAPAAAVSPTPRRHAAARPPDDGPMEAPPRKGGAPKGLLIGGALVAAVAVAAGGWWMSTRSPAAPVGSTVAPPPTVAEARPAVSPPPAADPGVSQPAPAADIPVEEEVTIVPPPRAGVSPSPVPSRAPAPPPTQVAAAPPPVTAAPAAPPLAVLAAGLVGRAEAARSAGDLDGAAELFDQALRTDPGNAAATSGKAVVTAARAAARKAFTPGRTVVQTQSAKSDMAGFDTADVSVKKAPDFSGRIEFAVNPPRVKPGDNYAVQIYLVNEGKKAIKVAGVSVTTSLNGSKSVRSGTSRVKEVAPSQRVLLEELPGVWPDEVNSWSTEVMVTANKGDSLKNLLTWK